MKQLLTLFATIMLIGCESSNDKLIQENESLLSKNNSLVAKQRSISEDVSMLKEENEKLQKLIPLLNLSSKSIFTDTLSKVLYEELVDAAEGGADDTSYQFLYQLSLLANPNRNLTQTTGDIADVVQHPNKSFFLHYLWSSIDRDPENISHLFDKNKDTAYKLLKRNNSYKSSGLQNTLKILLLAYKEMGTNKALLNQLDQNAKSTGVLADTTYTSLQSEDMKRKIAEFRDAGFVSYNHWVYSFWMRRHKEGNSKVVYQIIKAFDDEMSRYVALDEDDIYEDGF